MKKIFADPVCWILWSDKCSDEPLELFDFYLTADMYQVIMYLLLIGLFGSQYAELIWTE